MKKESVDFEKTSVAGQVSYSFSPSITENIALLKQILNNDDMVVYRYLKEQGSRHPQYCIVFADTLSSEKIINDKIIRPIMENLMGKNIKKNKLLNYLRNKVIACRDVKKVADISTVVHSILYGDTVVLVEGFSKALVINTKEWVTRAITEPESERITRGPREGFTESIKVNMSLLERKIVNPDLKFKYMELGSITKTKICVCYIEGIASKKILQELMIRLNKIDQEGILDSRYIQDLIQDSPLSMFSTIGDTERPDVVAAKLIEGRVAVICDGSPSVLTLPYLFFEYFQANEDYYNNYVFASMNRLLRILAFFLTTSIPAVYLAIVTFHQELLPTPLMLSIAAARKDVPFPTIVELIIMLLVFEVMREAGVRLPLSVGMAISIVGALVLGEAAVAAKIISAPMVIVTAFTGISAFLIFKMKGALIVVRTFYLIMAAFLGLYGYMLSVMVLVVYLISMRSFGVPYMMNASLMDIQNIQDTAVKAPIWLINKRPKFALRRAGAKSFAKK
ncbi:MAG: spore germination protein [Clostridia bacterium]|nr:spore germination protein [Clostridia bacterium]